MKLQPVRSKALRWLAGALLCGVCALLAVRALLGSLDRPWLKTRLLASIEAHTGLSLDYAHAELAPWTGLTLDGLVLRSAPAQRALAPQLLRVGRVVVRWSLPAALQGKTPPLGPVRLSNVELCVVQDEQGKTSFDALLPPKAASGPSVPPSQLGRTIFGARRWLTELVIDGIALTWLRTLRGELYDRTRLAGLTAALSTRAEASGYGAHLALRAPAGLTLSREMHDRPAQAAQLALTAALDANERGARTELELEVQTPALSAPRALHAALELRFAPEARRSFLTLFELHASAGAAQLKAALELPDDAAPLLHSAHAEVDLAQLLSWLPQDLSPLRAARARLRLDASELRLGATPLLERGSAQLELGQLELSGPRLALQVADAQLSCAGEQLTAASGTGHVHMLLGSAAFTWGAEHGTLTDLLLDADAARATDGTLRGALHVASQKLAHDGPLRLRAERAQLELRSAGLQLDPQQPSAAHGQLELRAGAAVLGLTVRETRSLWTELALEAQTEGSAQAPYAGGLDLRAARLELHTPERTLPLPAPLELHIRGQDVTPVPQTPLASTGQLTAALRLPRADLALDVHSARDALDFSARADARGLDLLGPWLAPALRAQIPLARIGLRLASSGHIDHPRSREPYLRHETRLTLTQLAYAATSARALSLQLSSRGTRLRHAGELALAVSGLALPDVPAADEQLSLRASVDRVQRKLQWQLASTGRMRGALSGALGFDASQRALHYELAGELGALGPLTRLAAQVPALAHLELSQLELRGTGTGALSGVIDAVDSDGQLALAPDPARTARVTGATDLQLTHLRWARAELGVAMPALHFHAELRPQGERQTLESLIELGALHLGVAEHAIDLTDLRHSAQLSWTGSLRRPDLELTQRLHVQTVEQGVVPEYPLGDLTVQLTAERNPDGVVHVTDLSFSNPRAGTQLQASGNVDLGDGRRSLSVSTSLTQDLARLSALPQQLSASGKLAVDGSVTSPDFTLYRVRAVVKGQDVSLALARRGLELQGATGEVPVALELEVGRLGLHLPRSEGRNPYSMLRFADQHPLLSRSGFLSIARLSTPYASIAPLVGNLEIDQNVISLRQFELGMRGGRVTGQCGLDWDGPNTRLELHVRASGVKSSHGEPFDGNIAVAISAAERTIDGRAEILRIGERHLLDLLDLQDPVHRDPAINRVRSALAWGYPKRVRLLFDHGFASAHLELGGLAKLISIGELRGLPVGPLVDQMLARMQDTSDVKEMP